VEEGGGEDLVTWDDDALRGREREGGPGDEMGEGR